MRSAITQFTISLRNPQSPIDSPLPLLMSLILANDSNSPLATNNLTLAAYLLYRCPYFHLLLFLEPESVLLSAFMLCRL